MRVSISVLLLVGMQTGFLEGILRTRSTSIYRKDEIWSGEEFILTVGGRRRYIYAPRTRH